MATSLNPDRQRAFLGKYNSQRSSTALLQTSRRVFLSTFRICPMSHILLQILDLQQACHPREGRESYCFEHPSQEHSG